MLYKVTYVDPHLGKQTALSKVSYTEACAECDWLRKSGEVHNVRVLPYRNVRERPYRSCC